MKKFDKSKIMREANRLMRVEGYNRSVALTLAWDKARRSEYYMIIEVRKPNRAAEEGSIMAEMNLLRDSLINYYANNTYNGD